MPPWAIGLCVLGGLAILYLIFCLVIAILLAKLIYSPPRSLGGSYEKIRSAAKAICDVDYDDFDRWEREYFTVKNGEYEIPCEYHPLPNTKGIAVVVHGFGQNRCMVVPHAKILRDLGYSTILFDQRAFGVSQARHGGFGYLERQDTAKVVDYVRSRFGKEIPLVLLGCSMGAISVLSCSRYTNAKIDAIIADSSPDRAVNVLKPFAKVLIPLPNPFLLSVIKAASKRAGCDITDNNPIEVAKTLTCPVLILHGEKDRTVPVECAHNIKSVLKNPLSGMVVFPGYDHCLQIGDKERYTQAVKQFLERAIQ